MEKKYPGGCEENSEVIQIEAKRSKKKRPKGKTEERKSGGIQGLWPEFAVGGLCLVAVVIKLIFYYHLMGVKTALGVTVLVTVAILFLFYNSFKNKKWAFLLYFFLSLLMLVDVTYYSYFNSYLSVKMMGAVGLLGGVQNSILEVLKPSYFLVLADWVLIGAVFLKGKRENGIFHSRKLKAEETDVEKMDAEGMDLDERRREEDTAMEEGKKESLLEKTDGNQSRMDRLRKRTDSNLGWIDRLWKRTGGDLNWLERFWKKASGEEGRLKFLMSGFLSVSLLMMMNPVAGGSLGAVLNQEFFTYHLKDAAGLLDQSGDLESIGDILAISGDYDLEKEGPEFGVGQGKNLIVIQVEAMQNFVIGKEYKGKEITPNLNRLLENDTFYFDTYYQQLGSGNTSDSEFATNNSLYGSMRSYTYEIFKDNYFRGLPVLLKEKGYSTMAFHAFDKTYWSRDVAYPGQGFDVFYSAEEFEPGPMVGMGLTDKNMFEQSLEVLKEQTTPFYAFIITLSSHHPFDIAGELDISEDTESMFLNYIQSMSYADSAIGEFIENLKAEGLYEDTVIAIYGDHFGLNPKDDEVREETEEYLGQDYWYETAMNIPMMIHVPGCGMTKTVSVPGGQTDFLPTIAYIMGFETLDTIHFGHNLLTVKDNFVPIRAYVQRGSFVTGDIMFQMSNDRIFANGSAVNIRTGEEIPLDDLTELYVKSVQLTNTSDYYLEKDILRRIYLEGETLEDYVNLAAEEAIKKRPDIPYNAVIIDGAFEVGSQGGVYTREKLDGLYEAGYREILVNMIYDANGNCFVLREPEDLAGFFQRPLGEGECYEDYEEFEAAKASLIAGVGTPMSMPDLADWIEAHPEAVVVMTVSQEIMGDEENEKHSILFIKEFMSEYKALANQVVFCVNSGEEVERANLEGLMNVILDVSQQDYSEKQMIDFISLYRVYAMAMTEEQLEDYSKFRRKWEGHTYVHREEPYDGKTLRKERLTGVIQGAD